MVRSAVAALFVFTGACGGSVLPPDRRVPADEPRATIVAIVDLPPSASCEERFDLALYADRAIDLITWMRPTSLVDRPCLRRTVHVRYLPRRTDRARVLAAVGRLVQRMEVVER
jgi:hypothetical protein